MDLFVVLGDRVAWIRGDTDRELVECRRGPRTPMGRLVVNPGSVGMPYGRAGAHWALRGN